jgi:hypothetical protein
VDEQHEHHERGAPAALRDKAAVVRAVRAQQRPGAREEEHAEQQSCEHR